jgi:hypothetical protein
VIQLGKLFSVNVFGQIYLYSSGIYIISENGIYIISENSFGILNLSKFCLFCVLVTKVLSFYHEALMTKEMFKLLFCHYIMKHYILIFWTYLNFVYFGN